MKIRNLTRADYPIIDSCMQELHNLHVQGRPDLYAPLEHPYSEQEFFDIVDDEKRIAIAAVDENDVILGFGIAKLRDRSGMIDGLKTAYVDDMFVRKEYRRQGIATKIFSELESRAKIHGAERIDLMVWNFNESALELYQSFGMKPQRYILEKQLS